MIERSFLSTYQVELSFVILFVITFNIIFVYLYRYSELINKRTLTQTLISINSLVLVSVIASYILLKPLPINKRVIFIPQFTTDSVKNNQLLLATTQIEQNLRNSNQRDILFMSFWWIFDAVNEEYVYNSDVYTDLANKTHIDLILEVSLDNKKINISGLNETISFPLDGSSSLFESSKMPILNICELLNIEKPELIRDYVNKNYITALKLFYLSKFNDLFKLSETIEISNKTMLPNLVISRAYSQKGSSIKHTVNFENPYHDQEYLRQFVEAQKRIFNYINQDNLNPDIYVPLIELQLFQENYDDANDGIKGFLTDFGANPILRRSEPEMYYLYSFLTLSKLKRDGYRSRMDLVKEALEINPFMEKAYRRYKYLIMKSPNKRSEATDVLFRDLEHYIQINSYSDSAKFILSESYLERGEIIKARRIFQDLFEKYKNTSEIHFNLGLTNFRIGRAFEDFSPYITDLKSAEEATETAIMNFKKAIEIGGNVNSYLYLGVIYKDLKDYDNAIKYFRLRVKHKIGENDPYAEEAKKGLRQIFEDETILKKYLEKENMLRDDVNIK